MLNEEDSSSDDLTRYVIKFKRCRGCKQENISEFSRYVNCTDCRKRLKTKQDLKKAKNAILEAQTQKVKGKREDGGERKKALTAQHPNKTNISPMAPACVALGDLEGDAREAAIAMMKHHVNRMVRKRRIAAVDQPGPDPTQGKEYQTASTLYNAVRSTVLGGHRRPRFKGFHTIVATDDISHKQRIEIVTGDLAKLAKVRFDRHVPVFQSKTKNETMRNAVYRCKCLEVVSKNQAAGVTKLECDGTVKITIEDDSKSHPSGIKGHKICVDIHHPALAV